MRPIYTVPNTWGTGVGANLIGHEDLEPGVFPWDFRYVNGAQSCIDGGPCPANGFWEGMHTLRVAFDVPTNLVQVRAHFPDTAIDGGDLRAYDVHNHLIARCHMYGDVPGKNPKYISPTPAPYLGAVCGKQTRRYECNSSGTICKSEHVAYISLPYPEIAYVLIGSETGETTAMGLAQVLFRRFAEDCTP